MTIRSKPSTPQSRVEHARILGEPPKLAEDRCAHTRRTVRMKPRLHTVCERCGKEWR